MADESLTRKSACELAALICSRAVSPVEVLDQHLAVIARVNPALNAIVTLAADQARECARAAETAVMRGEAVGALHGLPIGIKDIVRTAGIRTTFGSPLFRDFVPDDDAEVVARLKRAGAIVLAKTNTPEFATGANTTNALFGATLNPWNPALSPAGSSGGSAVAVATGMLPIAQGTDFGASIRVPAAFCGIVGIRPTPGLTPNHPMPLAWDPGQVHGPMARSAEDAALMLDAMTGFSRISPISVTPPTSKVCASPMRRISRASASMPRSAISAAAPPTVWRKPARRSKRSPSMFPMVASPIRRGAAPGWSASNMRTSRGWASSGRICKAT
jgi:amidase